MENKMKIIVTVALACFTALSLFIAHHNRKRKQRAVNCSSELDKKPQKNFKTVLADNSYTPFNHFKREGRTKENSTDLHPYEDEITLLIEDPPLFNFLINIEQPNLDGCYTWVQTRSQLEVLAELLSKEHVFAVDTEQHSLHSFLGFTTLMQISTQKEDYLLDTIALYDIMGILRPVFANPSICKVFHGADNDVLWLQRDFHIYVVNLFDTAKACEVLSKPQKSLAYLLETYCGTTTNKMLQREDWRLRPLSKEMVQYARDDAHYLLYIADCLAAELKAQTTDSLSSVNNKFNFFGEASRRSNMVCLQLYTKDVEASPGDSAAASIISRHLNGQGPISSKGHETKEFVRQLCKWRDLMARMHDESLRYVLSDQAVVALATKVPKTPQDIYDTIMQANSNGNSSNICYTPLSYIVRSHVMDILYLLEEDMDSPDDTFERVVQSHLRSSRDCPISAHDYAFSSEFNFKPRNELSSKQNGRKPAKQVNRKASRELFVQKFSCKSPVYHNCRIYASDGRLLCYCDRRKLEWYLHRDLAKLVENDPPGIMLLFEPKGRPEDEDNDFYIKSKKNICVGCGERNHYLRYRIIPSCYRMHFPEHLKSHRSHDIVLLCVDCHEIAHSSAEKYKKQIAKDFGIPLFVKKVVDSGKNQILTETCEPVGHVEGAGVSPLQLRTAAMALLRHGSTMPSKRREELTLVVRAYFGGREITDEDLETALLVGMSPQERRRLRKKRGMSFKNCSDRIILKTSNENNNREIGTHTFADVRISEKSSYSKSEDTDSCIRDTDHIEQNLDMERISQGENGWGLDADDNNYESQKLSDGTGSSFNRTGSVKHANKLSLLGHGPHGKRVVEYLLKEYGEDGIGQFCQRWRQVFVEAICPRFLPAGWDIMHSGRRDFGDYSVYNPRNNGSNAIKGRS